MITATFSPGSLIVQGHAGLAPHGEDILCAAVSILTYTLAARLWEVEERRKDFETKIDLEPGNARLQWSANTVEVSLLIHTIQTGFLLLSQKYPENLRLEILADV